MKYIPVHAIIGAPELVFCQAMLSKSGNIGEMIFKGIRNLFFSFTNNTEQIDCTVCGCSYKYHKHIYYQSRAVQERLEDANIKSQLKNKESAKAAVEQLIRDIERRSTEFEEEQEMISKSTAKFAHFLQNNAITPYNDAYEYFLEYTIDR